MPAIYPHVFRKHEIGCYKLPTRWLCRTGGHFEDYKYLATQPIFYQLGLQDEEEKEK
jgi:hypothetical protein